MDGEPGSAAASGSALSWGRRYLMCPPTHFGVLYEINPWMHEEVLVDQEQALTEWEGLVATLREAGAEIEVMDQDPSVPDMVFTANAGIVNGNQFVPSHFRFPERQPETEIFAKWFAEALHECRSDLRDLLAICTACNRAMNRVYTFRAVGAFFQQKIFFAI